MNIDPKDIRATILIHYYDIFKDSFLVKTNRNIRIKKELKNIKSNEKKNKKFLFLVLNLYFIKYLILVNFILLICFSQLEFLFFYFLSKIYLSCR